ncbi:MAG: aldehyde dehydrogenase family protein [Deltaproteobacteria bacterium]|nr:aldehyde dehydrogenase family protein [Deltaproteobacteria bacterium]
MTAPPAAPQKITYTSANVDLEAFHRAFDAALADVRARMGQRHPLHIGGKAVETGASPVVDRSPIDTEQVLGHFTAAGPAEVDQAMRAAHSAQRAWAARPWQERVAILRRAAALIRERKYTLAAVMSVEVGKNRMESMGDAEESADLVDYYCGQVEEQNGFTRDMKRMTPIEKNTELLRPFGVFACVAPFNFPLALSTGMSSAALVTGNAVVYKPAEDTPWTGMELHDVYRDAGVPAGVFNYLSGRGREMGDALWSHPLCDGVVFTGSREVGMRIFHGLSQRWVKPCLMELGGKNAVTVTRTADLDMAAEGVMRSTFGLQGQKCSATSRVYVDRTVAAPFLEKLLARTRAIAIGDVTRKDSWFGPVINQKAVDRYGKAVERARREGKVLLGGERLHGPGLERGFFVAPTVAELPLTSELFLEELFLPFLSLGVVDSFDQAIAESNRADYGLTAGLYTADRGEIARWFDEIEAGVCYVNKRSGATTGAWPGAQPFCGWKGSGATGKGGCGPWYVQQFAREQSRTLVEE